MNVFRKSHVDALQKAITNDPRVLSTREKPEPFDLWYLESLGLTEGLLKRMERVGLAARGYRREVGHPDTPKHKPKGFKVYWVLYTPDVKE